MSASNAATLLGEDVLAALTMLGAEPIDAVPITGLAAKRRATFRIRLADGRLVKARRFGRTAKAERFASLVRALAHEHVPPPLLVVGRVAIEAWVDGRPVSTLPLTTERLVRAADLLGSIHASSRPAGRARSTTTPVASTRRRLVALGDGRALTRGEVETLLGAVTRCAPDAAEVGITHNDLCAENLVEDAGGALVLVDNEGLRRGFLDYDLARTWYRWPMDDADWRAFIVRYRSWRPAVSEGEHVVFWRIAAVVKSAHLRAARGARDVVTPLARLRTLAAEL